MDGLAKASILDIDGVAVPSAVAAPTTAFSVRLLGSALGVSSYTGPAMRVRRDTAGGTGDDDEADIAFDSGVISLDSAISNASAGVTATTLGEFINVGTVSGTTYSNPDSLTVTASCFVDEWKDQSGNATHASQGTFGSQPQIHSGTVNTDLITENGKPALDFSSNKFLTTTSDVVLSEKTHSCVGTFAAAIRVWYGKDGNNYIATFSNQVVYRAGSLQSNGSDTPSGQTLYIFTRDATTNNLWSKNGANLTMSAGVTASQSLNNIGGFSPYHHNNNLQELVTWSSNYVSSRSGIETNINGFFGIY